jgi:hypothetical protein
MKLTRLRNVLLQGLVALSLAFLVWLYGRSRHQVGIDDVFIPIHIAMAAEDQNSHELEITGVSKVLASFSGPPSCIRELRGQLQRGLLQVHCTVVVPEEKQNDASYRDTVCVQAGDVPAPPGVTIYVCEGHDTVPITVHKIVERRLPVRLECVGEGRIAQLKLEPATVIVRGRQDVLDQARAVPTVAYAVPPAPESITSEESMVHGEIALGKELDGKSIQCSPATVAFRGRLHPRQRTYDLTDVPVSFLCPPQFPFEPKFQKPEDSKITLRVIGPAMEDTPQVQAFVDLTRGDFEKGRNREPLRIQLPKDFQPAGETPRLVTFILEPH